MADFQTTPLWQLGQPHTIKASEIQQQINMDKPQDQENAKENQNLYNQAKKSKKMGKLPPLSKNMQKRNNKGRMGL